MSRCRSRSTSECDEGVAGSFWRCSWQETGDGTFSSLPSLHLPCSAELRRREEAAAAAREPDISTLPFKPELNPNSLALAQQRREREAAAAAAAAAAAGDAKAVDADAEAEGAREPDGRSNQPTSTHDSLFEDAKRRLAESQALAALYMQYHGCTFKPDIGANHHRA
jgi:hypothetical protein